MTACLIARFLAMSASNAPINLSTSDNASAMARCSGSGGTAIHTADKARPLVKARVVYVAFDTIWDLTNLGAKQYCL